MIIMISDSLAVRARNMADAAAYYALAKLRTAKRGKQQLNADVAEATAVRDAIDVILKAGAE